MADKEKDKAKVDLGLLEEDDEFEEFPAEGEKQKIVNDDDKQKKNFCCNFQIGWIPLMMQEQKNSAFGKTIGMMITLKSWMTSMIN